ncbi:DoxX family protein [Anaeroselena agilis]|uniref:DoxX family protein n=1 Tax=Anaeroselena agilis TaxID=3063788 RepID=A0ABU3NXR0_9FIRM|nr:DoxX family protein [Selenomonadales bacterium 4137-cl]
MLCSGSDRFRDGGLLLLRVGLGLMFMYHGWPKVTGGVAAWTKLGMSMSFVGIGFLPPFWGFMAAASEFGGGLLLIVGLFFRPACLLLAVTMAVAVAMKFGTGAGLGGASQALELGIVFVSLLFIGPGRYSFDARLCGRRGRALR